GIIQERYDVQGAASALDASLSVLAYSLRIYYDFWAYSIIAIGLAKLFAISLPRNFREPYLSRNPREFWRRWHVTLSYFLRDYVYIRLGGNQAYARNILFVFALCGLWHGAGWNFVLWGGLHGLLLSYEHLRRRRERLTDSVPAAPTRLFLRRVSTCLWLAISFVFFRAESFSGALQVCRALVGWTGSESLPVATYLGEGLRLSHAALWIGLGLAVAWGLPNTQQILGRFQPVLDYRFRPGRATWAGRWLTRLQWRPHWAYALASAGVFGIALSAMSRAEEFLYFQF
ncbi:MAG: hypothetical protein KDA75_09340, partial [Planctomycetaceae bacterium]|nr:hypothetical protein [Planctomycetaceae bacterium]